MRDPAHAALAAPPPASVTPVALRLARLLPQLLLVHEQCRAADAAASIACWPTSPSPDRRRTTTPSIVTPNILQSLPGVGRVVAATMLTEASGPLAAPRLSYAPRAGGRGARSRNAAARRAVARPHALCRVQAPRRAKRSTTGPAPAFNMMRPRARTTDRLRQRGHTHRRALRSVGDRWLRILVAMLHTRTCTTPRN